MDLIIDLNIRVKLDSRIKEKKYLEEEAKSLINKFLHELGDLEGRNNIPFLWREVIKVEE